MMPPTPITDKDIARGDRNGGADYLFDDGGIGGHAAGDFGGAVFFKKARSEAEQVFLHRDADVGHYALTQPAHKIEAQRRRHGEHRDDHQQIAEIGVDIAAIGDEALVDDPLETRRDRQRRAGRDSKRDTGIEYLARIMAGEMGNHPELRQFAGGLRRFRGCIFDRFGGCRRREGLFSHA
jgi:hypothetical protein